MVQLVARLAVGAESNANSSAAGRLNSG